MKNILQSLPSPYSDFNKDELNEIRLQMKNLWPRFKLFHNSSQYEECRQEVLMTTRKSKNGVK